MPKEKYRLRYDASFRRGKRGIGYVIYDPEGNIIYTHAEPVLKQYSVLQLEMYAMLKGLEEINKRGIKKVKVRGDNKDVYRILKGKKEARSVDFLKVKIENFIDNFEYIKINWIPREINRDADVMSKIPTK